MGHTEKNLSMNTLVSSQQKAHYARSKTKIFALLSRNTVEKVCSLFISDYFIDGYGNLPSR